MSQPRINAYRPTLERICYISKLIREGTPFTSSTVTRHFECSARTIWRDIEFMRDRLGYEMEFHNAPWGKDHTWRGIAPKERIL